MVNSCELWIRKFAEEYCSQIKEEKFFNPQDNFNKLKIKYKNQLKITLQNKNAEEIDNLLVGNIRNSCPEKKHLILRFYNKKKAFIFFK